ADGLRVGALPQAGQHESAETKQGENGMSNHDMFDALQMLAAERGITVDTLLSALADALESAYKRRTDAYEYAWVTIDPDSFEFRVFAQEIDADGQPFGDTVSR